MTSIRHEPEEHANTARLESFSDGVFAIAITLLVLEIGVPHVGEGQSLGEALRHLWPSYCGFAVSFLTIGVMWINHHAMFKDIDRQDHTLLVLNLVLMMSISFLPFPTAVVAAYMRDSSHQLTAALTWGFTLIVISVAFQALWLYASIDRRLIDDHVKDTMREIVKEIQTGTFATQWLLENQAGRPSYTAIKRRESELQIEKVGAELRSMMPWLKKD